MEIFKDLHVERGPLGGLEAALFRTMKPYLVVLAIDLPEMRVDFLVRLLELAISRGRSVIAAKWGKLRTLAAVYFMLVCGIVAECLGGGDYSPLAELHPPGRWNSTWSCRIRFHPKKIPFSEMWATCRSCLSGASKPANR